MDADGHGATGPSRAAALLGDMLENAASRPVRAFPAGADAPDMPGLRYADGVYIEKGGDGWSARIEFVHPAGNRSSFALRDLATPDEAVDRARDAVAVLWDRERTVAEALPAGAAVFDLAGTTIVVGRDDVEKAMAGSGAPSPEEIASRLDGLARVSPDTMESVLMGSPDAVRTVVAAVSTGMRVWPVAPGSSSCIH